MPSPVWPLPICHLIHGPNIPGSCAVLLFRASDLTSITSHTHNWVLFLLWLHLFILSVELFLHWSPVAYRAPTDLGSWSFSVLSFCLFILFMGFSRQEYWSGLPFPSPVEHILYVYKDLYMGLNNSGPVHNGKSTHACMLSCVWLCDPMDYSPPGSSVHGIFQARILECLPFPSPKKSTHEASFIFDMWEPGKHTVYQIIINYFHNYVKMFKKNPH